MSEECVTILSSDNDDVQVIENSPVIKSTGNKVIPQCSFNGETNKEKRRVPLQAAITGKEIFTKFLEKCKSVDSSSDMELAIKKLWKRFNQAVETYTSSSVFVELVEKALKNVPSEPYYQLKVVADELNHNKKIHAKSKTNEVLPSTSEATTDNVEEETDPKTASHIKKLEKTVIVLHKRIQKLENNEVDFNSSDDDNSAYIQVSRYKERLCQVYRKICELQKKDPHAERPFKKHIKFTGTNIPAVDRAIEKFYNDRKEFPDYHDILAVVQKANEVKKLNLSPLAVKNLARQAFEKFFKTLQRWRMYDDAEVFNSYLANHEEEDPASRDEELRSRLEENEKKYGNRINEILEKYALKQLEENIQPEEVKSDAQSEESEEEEEEDPDSDCRSRSSILEWKSFTLSDSEDECYPECRVVLTDVRFTPEWEKYIKRLEKESNESIEPIPSTSKQASINEEKSLPPWLNRKRSHSEDEPSTSKKLKSFDDEPIPSTSKQSVPIVLGNYRHLSEEDDSDAFNAASTSKPEPSVAKTCENIESMSVNNDCDIIEVVSDSCEKADENEKGSDRDGDEKSKRVSDSPIKDIHSIDIYTEEPDDESQSKDRRASTPEFLHVDVCIDEVDGEVNLDGASSPSKIVTVEVHQEDTESESTDAAATQSDEIISVDICTDSETKASVDDPDDESTKIINLEESEPSQDSGKENALNEEASSDVVNVDPPQANELPEATDKINKKAENTTNDTENDEIMIISEIVKTPQKPEKKDDVIDVEEIADSPQKPKKLTQVTLGPVNLTQIIRDMQFGKTVNSANAQQKRAPMPSTSQMPIRRTDPRTGNLINTRKDLVLSNHPGISNQNQFNRSTAYGSRNSKIFNMQNVRHSNPMNVNQRKPLNNTQFLAPNARNLQQFFANNRNVSLQPTQTSMQKRQFTTHTVQQQKFNKRTNSIVTTKQVTTVVQESVMRVDSSQLPSNFNNNFQVYGQRTRVVNRRMQQVQRSTRSNVNNSSEDVITLD